VTITLEFLNRRDSWSIRCYDRVRLWHELRYGDGPFKDSSPTARSAEFVKSSFLREFWTLQDRKTKQQSLIFFV
jgi:hypothetical protein